MRVLAEVRGALTAGALIVAVLFAIVYLRIPIPGWQLLDSLRMHLCWALLAIALALALSGGYARAAIAGALAAAVLVHVVVALAQVRATVPQAASTGREIKVVSFNLLWSNAANAEAIVADLLARDADFVFLQEAGPIAPFRGALADVYPHQLGCPAGPESCDALLLSKHPLGNTEIRTLGRHSPHRFLTATTQIGGQAMVVALVHLTKPYFDSAAFGEILELEGHIDDLALPAIVAGDFNAAPWSANLRYLAERTRLAFGPNAPATWPVELGMLGLPIDHVLASEPLFVTALSAFENPLGSNHRGIVATLRIAPGGTADSR